MAAPVGTGAAEDTTIHLYSCRKSWRFAFRALPYRKPILRDELPAYLFPLLVITGRFRPKPAAVAFMAGHQRRIRDTSYIVASMQALGNTLVPFGVEAVRIRKRADSVLIRYGECRPIYDSGYRWYDDTAHLAGRRLTPEQAVIVSGLTQRYWNFCITPDSSINMVWLYGALGDNLLMEDVGMIESGAWNVSVQNVNRYRLFAGKGILLGPLFCDPDAPSPTQLPRKAWEEQVAALIDLIQGGATYQTEVVRIREFGTLRMDYKIHLHRPPGQSPSPESAANLKACLRFLRKGNCLIVADLETLRCDNGLIVLLKKAGLQLEPVPISAE